MSDRVVTALVAAGWLHDDARRVARLLREAGLRIENGAVGEHPDLIDRDGDRWFEVMPGRYAMDPLPGEVKTPAETALEAKPTTRTVLETNAGPLIAVPRLVGRRPVCSATDLEKEQA